MITRKIKALFDANLRYINAFFNPYFIHKMVYPYVSKPKRNKFIKLFDDNKLKNIRAKKRQIIFNSYNNKQELSRLLNRRIQNGRVLKPLIKNLLVIEYLIEKDKSHTLENDTVILTIHKDLETEYCFNKPTFDRKIIHRISTSEILKYQASLKPILKYNQTECEPFTRLERYIDLLFTFTQFNMNYYTFSPRYTIILDNKIAFSTRSDKDYNFIKYHGDFSIPTEVPRSTDLINITKVLESQREEIYDDIIRIIDELYESSREI